MEAAATASAQAPLTFGGPAVSNPAVSNRHAQTVPLPDSERARQSVQALLDLVVAKLPRKYDGDKRWQDTKKVWAGIKFRREGLRLETKRRWREVRHGLQARYEVRFRGAPDDPQPLEVNVRAVHPADRVADGRGGWWIDLTLVAPLDFQARIERWNLGVQAYSIEASGFLHARTNLRVRLCVDPDYSTLPPGVIIDPHVESADLHLDFFQVDRVSKVGGEFAERWGRIVESIAKQVFLEDFNETFADKLNQSIEKRRDDLRLSASDWLAKWQLGNAD
jgi:hypothetical protein